jgi:DNA polymerase III delta prime subunit
MTIGQIWAEKYRPTKMGDLIIDDDNKKIIESFGKNIPNLLFCGKAGIGKTTIAKIIVQDIMECDYLYINASDENGIDTIREKVIGFAQTMAFNEGLKVVILDESDFLSINAQAILRNVMESYSKTTRFILTGNQSHRISNALKSRCQQIDLSMSIKQMFERCVYILQQEDIKADKEQRVLLLKMVRDKFPDLRKCINEMQKYCIDGFLSIPKKNTNESLCSRIFDDINKGDTLNLRKYLIENDNLFGSDHEVLLKDLLNYIYDISIEDTKKKQAILTIADSLFKMVSVSDREICFISCMLQLEEIFDQ